MVDVQLSLVIYLEPLQAGIKLMQLSTQVVDADIVISECTLDVLTLRRGFGDGGVKVMLPPKHPRIFINYAPHPIAGLQVLGTFHHYLTWHGRGPACPRPVMNKTSGDELVEVPQDEVPDICHWLIHEHVPEQDEQHGSRFDLEATHGHAEDRSNPGCC